MDAREPPRATLREQILALVRRLPEFAECDPAAPVTAVFRCDDALLRLHIDPTKLGASHTDLPAVEQAVLRVCTQVPQTAKRVAGLTGYSLSRVRDAITRLTGLTPPLLIRVAGGVRLP